MQPTRENVESTLRAFLVRSKKSVDDLAPTTGLYADGVGLDSLETAELSAVLEDEFGTDPFSGDGLPRTVADILDFYRVGVPAV